MRPSPVSTPALAPPAHVQRGDAHRWRVLAVGVLANVAFSAAAAGIPTTAIALRSAYRLDNGALGIVLGALGLGVAVFEVPWGLAAMAVMLAAMAAGMVPHDGWTPPLALLIAAMALTGLTGGSVNGASGRAVMRWFRDNERGLAMSIRQTAVPLGGGLGAALLPPLAAHAGFAAVFGVLGGFVALAALLTWRWLHEPAGDIAAPAPRAVGGSHAAAAQPLRDPTLRRLVLGIGLLCVPQFAILSFATVFLHDFAGFGAARIGIAMVTIQLGAMVSRVWSGRATDRLGNRRAFVRGTAGLAFALFAALAAATCAAGAARSTPSLDLAALLLVAAGIAVSAWHGVAYAELATMAGAQRAGTALGMANTVVYAGYFLTPLAIPSLLTRGGWGLVWLAAAGVVLVALPCFPRAAAR